MKIELNEGKPIKKAGEVVFGALVEIEGHIAISTGLVDEKCEFVHLCDSDAYSPGEKVLLDKDDVVTSVRQSAPLQVEYGY